MIRTWGPRTVSLKMENPRVSLVQSSANGASMLRGMSSPPPHKDFMRASPVSNVSVMPLIHLSMFRVLSWKVMAFMSGWNMTCVGGSQWSDVGCFSVTVPEVVCWCSAAEMWLYVDNRGRS